MIFDADEIFDENVKDGDQNFEDTAFQKNIEFLIQKWDYTIDSLDIYKTKPSRLWDERELTWGELYASSDRCD